MTRCEEAGHLRSLFRQFGSDEAKKLNLVKVIRDIALCYLPPEVVAKVPPPYFSEEVEAAYKATGKNLMWNLTIDGDIGATGDYAFFFTATASDSVLTSSQKSAAALLYATLEALEKNALSDRITQNILDALGGLDADTQELGKKFKAGRKPNTGSVVRGEIAKCLSKDQTLKNPALWSAIAGKPPKGWEAHDNHIGKYLEGPRGGANMNYERFSNICGEERKKLKQ